MYHNKVGLNYCLKTEFTDLSDSQQGHSSANYVYLTLSYNA